MELAIETGSVFQIGNRTCASREWSKLAGCVWPSSSTLTSTQQTTTAQTPIWIYSAKYVQYWQSHKTSRDQLRPVSPMVKAIVYISLFVPDCFTGGCICFRGGCPDRIYDRRESAGRYQSTREENQVARRTRGSCRLRYKRTVKKQQRH